MSACLEQTISFDLNEEAEKYKRLLDKRHIKYKIEEEKTLDNGKIVIKLKRQYNSYDYGDYLQ